MRIEYIRYTYVFFTMFHYFDYFAAAKMRVHLFRMAPLKGRSAPPELYCKLDPQRSPFRVRHPDIVQTDFLWSGTSSGSYKNQDIPGYCTLGWACHTFTIWKRTMRFMFLHHRISLKQEALIHEESSSFCSFFILASISSMLWAI